MVAGTTPAPVPLWKNRDYLLVWSGQAISTLGTQVSQLAFPLLVLALTGSPAQAGFVAAARTAPYLLFSLPAGALVDRWDRKLTMILCSAGSGVALGSIALASALGVLTIAHIVAISCVEGTLALVFGLAQTAALPRVVANEQLPAAIAQQNAQLSLGGLLGPPLGGVLFSASHLLPFLLDASSYAFSACSLRFVRAAFAGQGGATRRSLWAEIGDGIGWLWRQPLLRSMMFVSGGLNFTVGLDLIIIVLAQRRGALPATIGLIFAVAASGGILGAVLAPRIQRRLSFGQAIIGLCWFHVVVFGLLAIAARSLLLVAALLTIFFLVEPTYNTVQYSYRLALIPDALQGRVNSAYRVVSQGMRPLGLALTGVLLERVGVVGAAVTLSGWLLAVALMTSLNAHVRHAPVLTA
jgi:predicted MFS family arabinose efflux permease